MKNNYIISLILTIFILICPGLILQGQELSSKLAIEGQIMTSSHIVEGAVISRKSVYDSNQTNIYTINTVEVYKVFKGAANAYIDVVTEGGFIGTKGQIIDPSLELSLGDTGLFLLLEDHLKLEQVSSIAKFKSNGASQGFYKYNLYDDVANNSSHTMTSIDSNLYTLLDRYTTQPFIEIKPLPFKRPSIDRDTQDMTITSVSPATITAGTKAILTINGSGFGSNQGTVSFKDANSGGTTFITALSSQIVSWSDTQIGVEVPSRAGNGTIRVNTIASSVESSDQIIVIYAERNFNTTGTNPMALQIQHVDMNGNGGYTLQLQTDFDSNVPAKNAFLRSLERWRCDTGLNMQLGAASTTNTIAEDGINIIRFDVGTELPNNNLGLTSYYFETCTEGGIVKAFLNEFDISFNDTTNWEFGPSSATGAKIDFETVSLHLLGHARLLEHVVDVNSNMNFFIEAAQNTRVLSANDIAGGTNVQLRSTTSPICGESIMTDAECTLSINEAILNDAISLFPNPAKHRVFLVNTGKIFIETIELFDLTGRLVTTHSFIGPQERYPLDLSGFSKGVYIVNIHAERQMLSKKLIIE